MRRRVPLCLGAALLAVALLAPAGRAGTEAQELCVVVVPGLSLADLEPLEDDAAVGVLVPGAGPRVSEVSALAALERGQVRNSLRGGLPEGPALIRVETASELPACRPAIVLGLPEGGDQPNTRRYPIAVIGDGYSGLLTSRSTHLPGLVSIVDIAPTALRGERALVSVDEPGAVAAIRALDRRIADNADVRPLAALLAGVLILCLALIAPRPALLGFGTALAANLVLGATGTSTPWVVLLTVGLAVGAGAPLLGLAVRSETAVAVSLAAVIGGYLVALAVDSTTVALAPLGPEQNSRFFGLSNLLSAFLLVPALASPALLLRRRGWAPALAVAALSLVTVAGGRFGADGGTAVVLVLAYAVLAVELAEARRRLVLLVAALGAAGVAALIAFDAAFGASSHLTDALGGGPSGFAADLRDRLVLAYERATEHWYTSALVVAGAVILALLAARLVLLGVPRAVRALPVAMAVATFASLVVNDSPLHVVSVGLVGYVTLQQSTLKELAPIAGAAGRSYRSVET
jgi:hypothetical protein